MRPTENKDLRASIARLSPWFHNLHLPGGVQTAPGHKLGDFPLYKWTTLAGVIPEDLHGWTALDVGCNAGFYSFELARRGARVTAIDREPHYLKQAHWAARQLELAHQIEFRQAEVYDLGRAVARYDLVLFMGVFYHLRHPLLVLDILSSMVERLFVFQTLTSPDDAVQEAPADMPLFERGALGEPGWPRMAFIEHSLEGDQTNWWAPNHAAVLALLRSAGFNVLSQPGQEIYVCEPSPVTEDRLPILRELQAALGTHSGVDKLR